MAGLGVLAAPSRSPEIRNYLIAVMDDVRRKNPAEPEFHQAVEEVLASLSLALERHPEFRAHKILERFV